jgi:hypothetical protein
MDLIGKRGHNGRTTAVGSHRHNHGGDRITGLRLVPRLHVDRTGHEPFRSGTYQQQLRV